MLTARANQYIISPSIWPRLMRLFDSLPRFTGIATVLVWAVTLPLLASFGRKLTEPSTLFFVLCIGLASLLILLAQNSRVAGGSWMLWVSAGIWTGAAYLNRQVVGFSYLLIALLALGSAAVGEHEHGYLSLLGAGLYAAALVITVGVSLALAG